MAGQRMSGCRALSSDESRPVASARVPRRQSTASRTSTSWRNTSAHSRCESRSARSRRGCTSGSGGHRQRSQGHGFSEDPLGRGRRPPDLEDIDIPPERFPQIRDQLAQVEHRPTRLHVGQEVDVAISASLTAPDGSEHADDARAARCRHSKGLLTRSQRAAYCFERGIVPPLPPYADPSG